MRSATIQTPDMDRFDALQREHELIRELFDIKERKSSAVAAFNEEIKMAEEAVRAAHMEVDNPQGRLAFDGPEDVETFNDN